MIKTSILNNKLEMGSLQEFTQSLKKSLIIRQILKIRRPIIINEVAIIILFLMDTVMDELIR